MQFRDLKTQYQVLKEDIDKAMTTVAANCNFISGTEVKELETQLAEYVGMKHCISCANGTDALQIALMVFGIKEGDAVFVPDFTFFSSGEVVPECGGTPVFTDVEKETFNMDPESLRKAVAKVKAEGKLRPAAVVAVDLFGLPAKLEEIKAICEEEGMYLLEDGAQGFGGNINGKIACSFGDISTTSFFPAKPLGCYGDGGAIFTDNDDWAALARSIQVHGKGSTKYDNIRLGMNSRLDTLQAAILKVKLKAFREYELEKVNAAAAYYTKRFTEIFGADNEKIRLPLVPEGYYSSWAQYTLILESNEKRDALQTFLKERGIPSMIYYIKPMHEQLAFEVEPGTYDLPVTEMLCKRVLSLPIHPYLTEEDADKVIEAVAEFLK